MTTISTSTADSPLVAQTLNQAIRLHQTGNLSDAEQLYRMILKDLPQHPDANHNLGILAMTCKNPDVGLLYLKTALEANPNHAQYWLSYITALLQSGQHLAAQQMLDKGRSLGLRGDAVENLARQLTTDLPALPASTKQKPTAQKTSRQSKVSKKVNPQKNPSSNEISALATLYNQGLYSKAETYALKFIQRYPKSGVGWKALGAVLKAQGRTAESLEPKQKAVFLSPNDAEAHNNLGFTYYELDRLEDAEVCIRRALALKPDFSSAHNNLGNIFNALGRLEYAEASYRQALALSPDFSLALGNLCNVLKELGHLDEASACYNRVLAITSNAFHYAVHAQLLLPVIIDSLEGSATWLKRYKDGIETLGKTPGSMHDPIVNKINPLSFYLAYHNNNDKQVMIALARFFCERIPELSFTSPHIHQWSAPLAAERRIRVGFISKFLVGHTIGKLYQGYISHLDRSKFEVVVIHLPQAKQDDFSQNLTSLADKTVILSGDLATLQTAIAAEKLDVLFYPDIGMAPVAYYLAFARLAPVQAVSWGHPDTTGLDTIDYFISATSIEYDDAEEHYAERLIKLNRLPCHYQPLFAPVDIPPRTSLGLPEAGTLYGCPQALFKFHPDFDAVLAAIAVGDPTGHIVLLEGKHHSWTELLRKRWAESFPILLERVLFLPRMSLNRFMMFIATLDVLLDPIHFGSGNTLYEGMVCGTPIVTWPGRFMRGRIVAGAYRQMGISDAPIATSLGEYSELALALGRDPERREALRQASLKAADRELFADLRAVRELESFLEAAVDATGRGEKLPSDWNPEHPVQIEAAQPETTTSAVTANRF